MLQYKGKSLNKVYAEPGKVWNFIFEIPGLEEPGNNEIMGKRSGILLSLIKKEKKTLTI